jgi:hypothetical protein
MQSHSPGVGWVEQSETQHRELALGSVALHPTYRILIIDLGLLYF